jgi:hypothetical protein
VDHVAFFGVRGFHGCGDGAVELVAYNRLNAAVGADRIEQGVALHLRYAHRNASAQKVTRREKNENKDNGGPYPKCRAAYF